MRALKLKLSAFGPFSGQTLIDFESFGDRGIYLITGDTGAGKTTIFDAIAFSLYGTSSGGLRDPKMLRSEYADVNTPTFVEFEFSYKDRIYKIYRNPSYERPKKRGEGFTLEEAQAVLYFDDGTNINSLNQVNQYIEELFGLNESQFKQIAMIAQGDFLKFLHANNEEKRALFRKIFQTENFSLFEEKIKREKAKIESDLSLYESQFDSILDNISLEEEVDFALFRANKKTFKEVISRQNDKDLLKKTQIEESLASYKNELSANQEKYLKAVDFHKISGEILEKNKELDQARIDLIQLKKDLDQARGKDLEIENLSKKISLEEESLSKYSKLEDRLFKAKQAGKALDDLGVKLLKLEEDINKKGQKYLELEKFIEENTSTESKIVSLEVENKALTEKKESLKALGQSIDELKDWTINLNKNREALALQNNKVKNLHEEKGQLEYIYFANQAGLLAKDLKEGEPCPVCGALDHPKLASLPDDYVDKSKLDDLEEIYSKEKDKRDGLSQAIASLESRLDLGAKKANAAISGLGYEIGWEEFATDLESRLSGLDGQIKACEAGLKDLKNTLESLKTAKKDFQVLKLDLSSSKDKLSASNIEKTRLNSEIDHLEADVLDLRKELKYEDKSQADKALKSLIAQRDDLLELKTRIEKAWSDKELEIARLESQIETLSNKKDETFNLDLGQLEDKKVQLEASQAELLDEKGKIDLRLKNNSSQFEKYKVLDDSFEKLSIKYGHIKDIYRTVTGQISGKDKLQFEVFVQMHYFDQIIERANKRFYDMSFGQYQLARKDGASDLVSQSGLEIEILDKYSAKARHVKTLSGGESFKAALSLALGLSDTVQMYSGGVEIDNMFIDEGFGSLDRESLSQVMASLSKITESKKIIGIISHVESLKDTIDKKIEVKKGPDGTSKVNLIN